MVYTAMILILGILTTSSKSYLHDTNLTYPTLRPHLCFTTTCSTGEQGFSPYLYWPLFCVFRDLTLPSSSSTCLATPALCLGQDRNKIPLPVCSQVSNWFYISGKCSTDINKGNRACGGLIYMVFNPLLMGSKHKNCNHVQSSPNLLITYLHLFKLGPNKLP